jgi:Uncharacterized conserved protein
MTRFVVERRIAARPETVFAFLTQADQWTRWQGTEAELDPRPGGVFRVNVRDGAVTSGAYVQVAPPHRVTFTWGFEVPGHQIPPGSTLVEIDLIPDANGTLLRLTHSAVPPPAWRSNRAGTTG